jgi:hypothetical protein
MEGKKLRNAALASALAYGPIPAAPLLDALEEPAAAHRKESEHDDEGERDAFPAESAQPVQSAGAGATGPGAFVRNINESIPSPTDHVTSGPTGPRNIFETRSRVAPVVQDPRWKYDPPTKQGTLTCSNGPCSRHILERPREASATRRGHEHDPATFGV